MPDRDTQFAGFASAEFDEIDLLFRDLARERTHEDYETASKTVESIKALLAQHAYDLALHVTAHMLPVITRGDMGNVPDMPTTPAPLKGVSPIDNPANRYRPARKRDFQREMNGNWIDEAMNTPVCGATQSEVEKQIERETKQ